MFGKLENYLIAALIIAASGGVMGLVEYLKFHGLGNPAMNAFVLSALLALGTWMKNSPMIKK